MINYSEYRVPKSMSLFVKKIWTLDNLYSSTSILDKGALPNGCFNIAIIRGKGLVISHMGKTIDLRAGTYFCGQMTESLGIEISPYSRATMVQLYPWTPVHFTRIPMYQFADCFFPSDELFKGLTDDIDLKNSEICRALVKQWSALASSDHTSVNLHLATLMIIMASGEITMEDISTRMGCSIRYLQKLFKAGVGISPKKFTDIVRLRGIVDKLAFGEPNPNLTTLAVSNTFYDQAHFTHSFRNMFGTTPKKFEGKDYFLSYIK